MLDIKKHKIILLQILKDIYSEISIAPVLGFKGGTACFLFYGLPRFSVDLDFDLLDLNKKEIVFAIVGDILKEYGDLKEKYRKKNTLFFLLSYEKGVRNIKVEISLRSFGSRYEIKNYLGISMLVMKQEDIFANKLAALLERKQIANRDIYDTWFFLKKGWSLNKDILWKRTEMDLKEYLKLVAETIEKVKNQYILTGLGELLDEKQKKVAREKLKEDTLFLLKLYMSEM